MRRQQPTARLPAAAPDATRKVALSERQNRFLRDHQSGASQVAEQFLLLSQRMLRSSRKLDSAAFVAWVRRCRRAHPSMAGLLESADRLERTSRHGREVLLETIRLELLGLQDQRIRAARVAADRLAGVRSVLTLSQSSLVLETLRLRALQGPTPKVLLCESRPLMEARQMARRLVRLAIPVDLFVDAAVALMAEQADAALLGADTILADGTVINKIGSLPLALACSYHGIPLVVVAESVKRMDIPVRVATQNPAEVWSKPLRGVRIFNRYFETVPAELIDVICTDLGPMSVAEWAGRKAVSEPRRSGSGHR